MREFWKQFSAKCPENKNNANENCNNSELGFQRSGFQDSDLTEAEKGRLVSTIEKLRSLRFYLEFPDCESQTLSRRLPADFPENSGQKYGIVRLCESEFKFKDCRNKKRDDGVERRPAAVDPDCQLSSLSGPDRSAEPPALHAIAPMPLAHCGWHRLMKHFWNFLEGNHSHHLHTGVRSRCEATLSGREPMSTQVNRFRQQKQAAADQLMHKSESMRRSLTGSALRCLFFFYLFL